jgi:hypothetical protein
MLMQTPVDNEHPVRMAKEGSEISRSPSQVMPVLTSAVNLRV